MQTAVYLLPLRHPVPVARQVASLAALAPGRLVFGVGLGGEDPAELRACGIDPATRGRRMDEALAVLRPLLAGSEVTMRGAFFDLDQVRIQPAPEPRVPIVIGGRSDAALRRVARHGDGWLGLWVSPGRYAAAVELIAKYAADGGRPVAGWQHGMHVWCGLGDSAATARSRLAAVMEAFYRTPFGKFEQYCPCGTPAEVAAGLRAYAGRGLPVVQPDPGGGYRTSGHRGDGRGACRAAGGARGAFGFVPPWPAQRGALMTERVAIVTGGTRGIGAAISEVLAADGTHVAAVYAGNHDAARALAGRITAAGGSVSVHPGDVGDPEFCQGWSPGWWRTGDGWTTWSTTPAC